MGSLVTKIPAQLNPYVNIGDGNKSEPTGRITYEEAQAKKQSNEFMLDLFDRIKADYNRVQHENALRNSTIMVD